MSLLLFAAALAAAPAGSDGVLGLWKTQTRNGIVEISRCGASVCGRLVTSDGLKADPNLKDVNNANPGLRGRPLKGLPILSGFKADGAVWNGGKIYNAEDGKTYSARLTPSGNQLQVRGCIFVPLCKTQTWTRIR
ncbi:DUF2147 domain-containing protein [Sphingomonas rosea]|uniref:DUF2147 domain-containing protein n=1 Tax=Sphingomonas rosea TaxID=335605 RepID=A0ABP7TXA5_9SPHN